MNETEIISWARGHVDGLNSTDYTFHPVLIDAVFQVSHFNSRLIAPSISSFSTSYSDKLRMELGEPNS